MHRRQHLATFSLFIAFCTASPAHADPAPNPAPAKIDEYGYVFRDDPLAAGGFGDHDVHIPVRRPKFGGTLVRPRTNFVPELLKTVETL
jgi:hypothetical protein